MHIASLMKIPCYLLKLSSGNENMGVSRADNSVKIWRNLPISNPKPDLHNINAQTKFGENPLMFTQVIIRKRKTDGQMDRLTDNQHETIIPRHYCVAGYKKAINVILHRTRSKLFEETDLLPAGKQYWQISCSRWGVNLYPLWVNINRLQIGDIFLIFFQKTWFDISCKLSPLEIICMKCESLFSWKNKKNISFRVSSAEKFSQDC